MGALHDGHIDLISRSRELCNITVCSIFVNPTQFNNQSDFHKYPNRLENDILMLEKDHTDILFLPNVEEIYSAGTAGLERYEIGYLETILEGKYRPGHFQGVCQVMKRLLAASEPDFLFMGQKDYQQCMVVQKLIALLEFHVKFVACPTLREPDGLAMSSRNLRLTPEQRSLAARIYSTLIEIKEKITPGDLSSLIHYGETRLAYDGFKVDYVAFAHAETLEPVTCWNGQDPLIVLIAAFLGEVRLIDNMLLNA